MRYWLSTWDAPDNDIDDGWAIYEVVREFEDEDEGVDMIEVGDVVYDTQERQQYINGDESDFYDDAVTDDPKRVIAFLFDQRFYL